MIIACPHCGKQVSDECDTCIHCGKPIASPKPGFGEYPEEERRRLHEEFLATHKKYNYGEAGYRQSKKAIFLFAGIVLVNCLFYLIVRIYLPAQEEANNVFLIGVVLGALSVLLSGIGMIAAAISRKRYLGKMLLAEKIFQAWLKREKGISYKVAFSIANKNYKKIFDSINIEKYPY